MAPDIARVPDRRRPACSHNVGEPAAGLKRLHALDIGSAGAAFSARSPVRMAASIQRDLPLSGEGAFAAAARRGRRLPPGQTLPGRPALRHRERAVRLRPGRARLFPQAALPDADAQRAAGGAANRLRRGDPHADDPTRRPRGRARRSAHRTRAAPRSRLLRRFMRRRTARAAARCCTATGHSFSDVAEEGRVDHQSRLGRGGRERRRRAGRSAALSRAISMSSGWPAWHEFDLLGREIAIGRRAAEGGQAHRALRGDQRRPGDRHARPRRFPRRCCGRFGHADCGIYAEVIAEGEIAIGDAIGAADLLRGVRFRADE